MQADWKGGDMPDMELEKEDWQSREKRFYTDQRRFLLLVILVHFLWAIGVPLTKLGYEALGIGEQDLLEMFLFAGIRLFFAGFLALLFCLLKGNRLLPSSWTEFWELVKLSVIMSVIQYVCLYIGTALSQGVVASILASSGAFQGILFSSLVFKEDRMTPRKITGCILGVIAVVILNLHDIRTGMTVSVLGGLLIIASQGAGTLGAVYLKYISQGKNAVWIGAWQTFLGGAFLIAAGFAGGGRLKLQAVSSAAGPTVGLIAASCLALILSNQLYKYNDISKVVIFTLLLPVFGTISSAILLRESLASAALLVSLLINCIGVCLVTTEGRKEHIRAK